MARPSSNTSKALAILSDKAIHVSGEQLPTLAAEITQNLASIPRLEREASARAILAGLGLWKAKEAVGHGKFERWLSQICTSGADLPNVRQCRYYMSLSRIFLDKVRGINRGVIIAALAGGQLELSLSDPSDEQRQFFGALKDFVGEMSLNELLAKHGVKEVKKLGGAREKAKDETTTEAPNREELRFQATEEISGALARLETLLLTENRLQYLVDYPDDIKGIIASLEHITTEVAKAAKAFLKKS